MNILRYPEVMAQDSDEQADEGRIDTSHDPDMVTLFSSSAHDAESEAAAIYGMLKANGIPSVVINPYPIPSLEFQVRVPRAQAQEAERLLEEARAAGPEAAAEAERATEDGN